MKTCYAMYIYGNNKIKIDGELFDEDVFFFRSPPFLLKMKAVIKNYQKKKVTRATYGYHTGYYVGDFQQALKQMSKKLGRMHEKGEAISNYTSCGNICAGKDWVVGVRISKLEFPDEHEFSD